MIRELGLNPDQLECSPLSIAVYKQDIGLVKVILNHLPVDKFDELSIQFARSLPDGTIKEQIRALLDVNFILKLASV